eukprot:TRINITY_DN14634_c0_g1_i1.p1 TRINITY_DN14634_c0_g1~~TRINITY_DN14634_c0_g1_i1.p1  ORF type:complete len:886 (-),score=195.96 TRINITY_DN14634_c0_g1_i1:162-2819(-)
MLRRRGAVSEPHLPAADSSKSLGADAATGNSTPAGVGGASVSFDEQTVILEGWLHKRSQVWRQWRPRYCYLTGEQKLLTSETESREGCSVFDVRGASVFKYGSGPLGLQTGEHSFVLQLAEYAGGKKVVFKASSSKQMMQWIDALKKAASFFAAVSRESVGCNGEHSIRLKRARADSGKQTVRKPEEELAHIMETMHRIPVTALRYALQDREPEAAVEDHGWDAERRIYQDSWCESGYATLQVRVKEAVGLSETAHNSSSIVMDCQGASHSVSLVSTDLGETVTFIVHRPLCYLYLGIVDTYTGAAQGLTRLEVEQLPSDDAHGGYVVLQTAQAVSGLNQPTVRDLKVAFEDGATRLGRRPLPLCKWRTDVQSGLAVKLELTFKMHSWKSELLACCLPMTRHLLDAAADSQEAQDFLVKQLYGDLAVISNICVLECALPLLNFLCGLLLWQTPERSLALLAAAIMLACDLPGAPLLIHPMTMAACFTGLVVSMQMGLLVVAPTFHMHNFWAHSLPKPQKDAEVLIISPPGAYHWQSIKRDQHIPEGAVQSGVTTRDGTNCVGRYEGEIGKINMEGKCMWNFWGHANGKQLSADILVIPPEARLEWRTIRRGEGIPKGAVQGGLTVTDGVTFVGRFEGMAGKINVASLDDDKVSADGSQKSNHNSNDYAVRLPLLMRFATSSATGGMVAGFLVSSEQRAPVTRLAHLLSNLREAVVWLYGAFAGDEEDDSTNTYVLLAGVWGVAIACTIASVHFWLWLGVAFVLMQHAPYLQGVMCLMLGPIHYALRPRRDPGGPAKLLKALPPEFMGLDLLGGSKEDEKDKDGQGAAKGDSRSRARMLADLKDLRLQWFQKFWVMQEYHRQALVQIVADLPRITEVLKTFVGSQL